NSKSPYLFESDFLNYVIDDNFSEEHFILSRNEIEELLIKYFRQYLNNSNELSNTVWALFHNCKTITTELNEKRQSIKTFNYFDTVQELLINFMKKDLDNFLLTFIEAMPFRGSNQNDNLVGISNGIKNSIFGSFDAFEVWLNDLNESDLV